MQQNLQRIIWLSSFPKSGNTWTRAFLGNYLAPKGSKLTINQLNTFTTGDVRQDFWDAAWGGPYQGQNLDTCIAQRPKVLRLIAGSKPNMHFVKTHTRIDRINGDDLIPPDVTAAAIYIIRNPFDVALSLARHISKPVDEAIDRMSDVMAITASDTGIAEILGRWDDHVQSWRDAHGLPLFFMRYEDMAAQTEPTFRRLLDYLKIPVNDGQLRRAIRNSSFKEMQKQEAREGFGERPDGMDRFFQSGKAGGWERELTAAQVQRIATEFDGTIRKHYPEYLTRIQQITGQA